MTDHLANVPFSIVQGARADAVMTGSYDAVMEHVLDSRVRQDAASLLEDAAKALGVLEQVKGREDALTTRQVRAFCDSVARTAKRLDELEAHQRAVDRKRAQDEARAAMEYMDTLPDPDDPERTHHPGGDLHTLDPVESRQPAAVEDDTTDAHDNIPDPDDPTGVNLKIGE